MPKQTNEERNLKQKLAKRKQRAKGKAAVDKVRLQGIKVEELSPEERLDYDRTMKTRHLDNLAHQKKKLDETPDQTSMRKKKAAKNSFNYRERKKSRESTSTATSTAVTAPATRSPTRATTIASAQRRQQQQR